MLSASLYFRNLKRKRSKTSTVSKKSRSSRNEDKLVNSDKYVVRRPSLPRTTGEAGDKSLYLSIQFTEKDDQAAVYYKNDAERFSQPNSLKLKSFLLYNVTIEMRPAHRELVYVVLGGKRYNCFYKQGNDVENGSKWTFVWSTHGIRQTERKQRSVLPCVIKFESCKELHFQLLVKFYCDDEVRPYGGKPLSSIDLDCSFIGKDRDRRLAMDNLEFVCFENS